MTKTIPASTTAMLASYIAAALFTGSDYDTGVNFNKTHTEADLTPEARARMEEDVRTFHEANALALASLTPEQAGYCLWMTRNHEGTGFWDRDLGELGRRLTAAAHRLGEASLYLGDDNQLHHS